jgi:hypothetical protein
VSTRGLAAPSPPPSLEHLPGKLMRAAKLVTLTKRGDVLHLRKSGPNAFVTRMVPIQFTSICLSNGSIVLPNSTSPVARMPALFTTASSSVALVGGGGGGVWTVVKRQR